MTNTSSDSKLIKVSEGSILSGYMGSILEIQMKNESGYSNKKVVFHLRGVSMGSPLEIEKSF